MSGKTAVHAEKLRELLSPLGPYRSQGAYSAGELSCEGHALDGVLAALEELEREVMLDTAQGMGLEAIESLLAHRPMADTPQARRAALAALLRIGGDSFTLEAINDNLRGCGLNVKVSETGEPGVVEVTFPDVPGIPEGFWQLRNIIEDILPAHVKINYVYWYITWEKLEEKYGTWAGIEAGGPVWGELEKPSPAS